MGPIKKYLSLVLAMLFVVVMFSGCVYESIETTITEDGSGNVHVIAGFSEDLMEYLKSMGAESTTETDLNDFVKKEINGEVYYVVEEDTPFATIEDFNTLFNQSTVDSSDNQITFKLEQDAVGNFTLTIDVEIIGEADDIGGHETTEIGGVDLKALGFSEEDIAEIIANSTVQMEISFPTPVYLYSNNDDNVISVNDNKVTLNLLEYSDYQKVTYIVKSVGSMIEQETPNKLTGFSDVSTDDWFAETVARAVSLGLFNGVTEPDANGLAEFAPKRSITRAEFITVILREIGLKPEENPSPVMDKPYWFDGYIRTALEYGIIFVGDFDDYTVPMTREEMSYVIGLAAITMRHTLPMTKDHHEIPDWDKIGEKYKNYVIRAYSAGLLMGVDNAGTFNPQGVLNRAEAATVLVRLHDYMN